jgi:hypothetical protein
MRMSGAMLAVALAPGVIGCNGQQPLSPTGPNLIAESPRPSAPTIADGERWNLTTRLTSVTGRRCEESVEELGENVDWLMVIARAGESVTLHLYLHGDPSDHLPFTGTIQGNEFSAVAANQSGRTRCDGTQLGFTSEARASGRFSVDGRALTGEHTTAVHLASSETSTTSYEWNATLQENR